MKFSVKELVKIRRQKMPSDIVNLYVWSSLLFSVNLVLSLPFHSRNSPIVESDVAEFTFLSNVNITQVHQSEYHVINVNIPSRQVSYIMHLSKPDDLFSPEPLDIPKEQVDHYKCLYSGTVSSSHGDDVGMVSLSSCFHPTGFEGLLYLQNEHYYVTPTFTTHAHRHKRFDTGPIFNATVNHRIAKPKKFARNYRDDSEMVPEEILKKARKQMIADQKLLEDEREEEGDNSDPPDDFSTSSMLPGVNSGGKNYSVSAMKIETMTQSRNKISGTKANIKKPTRVIELAVFTDEYFYKEWKAKHPKDTVKKIKQYILALVNNMNYLYQQPSMEKKISFRLVHIGIQKELPSGLDPGENGSAYLNSFCTFAGKKDKDDAVWDHAMMITGLNLTSKSGGGILGIAYTSTMCLQNWSCSLTAYNKGFETTFTATHEVGHSLGMKHDGEEMNTMCDPAKFIMGAVADAGQINWSSCSNQNVQNFIASGDPQVGVEDPDYVPRCLTKKGSVKKEIQYRLGRYPGQVYNIKRQCQQACDKCTPYVTKESPYNDVCASLYCQLPSKDIIALHPALEGTTCGKQGGKKKCRNGKCQ